MDVGGFLLIVWEYGVKLMRISCANCQINRSGFHRNFYKPIKYRQISYKMDDCLYFEGFYCLNIGFGILVIWNETT